MSKSTWPDVPTESIAAGDFTVTCEAKDHRERLHLLVIGVGPYKADQLRDQALSAFKGQLVDHSTGRFKSPAFQEDGYLYGPLVGEAAQRNRVLNLLARIHEALIKPESSLDEAPTEIIVIYYVGDERHTTDATALRLGAGEGEEVEMEEISQYFSETRGNQVFLLDVNHDPDRDTTSKSPRTPDDLASLVRDPQQALPVVLRFSWNGRGGSQQVAPSLRGPPPGPHGNPIPRLDPQATRRGIQEPLRPAPPAIRKSRVLLHTARASSGPDHWPGSEASE